MPLRDFIQIQLYGASVGYFNHSTPPLAPLHRPLDFKGFLGKADYFAAVAEAHEQLGVGFLDLAHACQVACSNLIQFCAVP